MKRILYFFSVMLCILAVTGCQDRDIIDFKDGVSFTSGDRFEIVTDT